MVLITRHLKRNSFTVTSLILCLLFFACKKKDIENGNDDILINIKEYTQDENEVETIVLKKETFRKEIVSNGKLEALKKNQLKFKVSETIDQVYVKNGSAVKKGQLLIRLNNIAYAQAVDKARINVKRLELELQDKLVGRGYFTFIKDSIPEEEYNILSIKTGHKAALQEFEKTKLELRATELIAPFSGKIASVLVKKHEHVSANKNVISIIDDTLFEVNFYLIEKEISQITINSNVSIAPLALNKTYTGKIININPQVEKDGTILVKAMVKNDGNLIDGMNVKVLIQEEIPNQFVIPKTAVVLRQNQEVIFKVKFGKAYWTYIQTTNENSEKYSIIPRPDKNSSILEENDTIVVSGNLSLAHDSEVVINNIPYRD